MPSDFQRARIILDESHIIVTGASGSGKSTFTRKIVKEYKKIWKDREVYLFSALNEDESLDEIKPKRFRIDDRLVSNPFE